MTSSRSRWPLARRSTMRRTLVAMGAACAARLVTGGVRTESATLPVQAKEIDASGSHVTAAAPRSIQCRPALPQKRPLGGVRRHGKRGVVGERGLVAAAQTPQQIRAHRVEHVEAGQREGLD